MTLSIIISIITKWDVSAYQTDCFENDGLY